MQRDCLDKHDPTYFSYVGLQSALLRKIGVSKRTCAPRSWQVYRAWCVIKLIQIKVRSGARKSNLVGHRWMSPLVTTPLWQSGHFEPSRTFALPRCSILNVGFSSLTQIKNAVDPYECEFRNGSFATGVECSRKSGHVRYAADCVAKVVFRR